MRSWEKHAVGLRHFRFAWSKLKASPAPPCCSFPHVHLTTKGPCFTAFSLNVAHTSVRAREKGKLQTCKVQEDPAISNQQHLNRHTEERVYLWEREPAVPRSKASGQSKDRSCNLLTLAGGLPIAHKMATATENPIWITDLSADRHTHGLLLLLK